MRATRREALRRISAVGMALPMGSFILSACAPAPQAPAAKTAAEPTPAPTKSKAIVGIVQEPTALDPTADATASIALCLRDNLYEGLVRLDGTGKIVGSLAKSWTVSQDATTFTFSLVSGARWHDGTPFTAQDVKFAYERAADANTKPVNPHRDYWDPVRSVEAIDDTTVKVTLGSYSDNWLYHMAAGSACIVSSKSAGTNTTNPVGTGPFKFGQWNRGSSLTLTRNDEYWGTKAKLRDIEFRFISDANAMTNALKAGDIDAIGQFAAFEQLAQLEQDPNLSVLRGAPAGKVMVSVNETSGPLADVRVRQALYAALDRKAWIDGFWHGNAEPIGSHAAKNDGEPYYVDMTGVNPYDPAKARQLLAAAGQTNLRLRLAQVSAFPYAARSTDIFNSQLQAVGVTLDVQPMEFPRWLQEVFLNAQNYDLTIINHVEQRDIANYANPKYYWHYSNAQVADWLKQADAQPDETRRKDLYARVQKQLADDAANLWVCSPHTMAILRKNLTGYQVQGISPSVYLAEAAFS